MGRRMGELQYRISKLGTPPLPLLQEINNLMTFLADSLDDFVEDCVKVALVVLTFKLSCYILTRFHSAPRQRRDIILALILTFLMFPLCDYIGDSAGDRMHEAQNFFRTQLGLRPKIFHEEITPPDVPYVVQISDDYVEDTFKALCVGSHAALGVLLGQALVPAVASFAAPTLLAQSAGIIVAIGGPVAQYKSCDTYGDRLGDTVQRWLAKQLRRRKH